MPDGDAMNSKCYVVPTRLACNADCWFCSAKQYSIQSGVEVMPPDDRFQANLDVLGAAGIRRLELTGGGEPFLNTRLSDIISSIRIHSPVSYIKLYTNGSILRQIVPVDELNISRAHWNDSVNQAIMRFANHAVPTLETSVAFFRGLGCKRVRLSIALMRAGIESPEDLDEFVRRTGGFVDEYVVRPLYPITPSVDERYRDFEYNSDRVVFDREACCHVAEPLIWAADNKFYNDWSLGTPVTHVTGDR